MKNNSRKEIVISMLICLLPILAGLYLYDRLPETIATHFGANGEANGWSSRAFAVFGIPAFMAGCNLLVWFAFRTDPKRKNMNPVLRAFAIWLVPALSIFVNAMTLGNALGYAMHIEIVAPLLLGLLFIVIGNYLPKTKQSYTMGIRLPWTLASEENWNRTHRIAGFLWVFGGAVTILLTLLRIWSPWLLFTLVTLFLVLIPTVYSFLLYKKGV